MGFIGIWKFLVLISLGRTIQAALVWNTKGEAALFISIAVPIDLPTRHVFMSYNFEAGYKLPRTWHKEPPVFRRGNTTHLGLNEEALEDFEDYYDDYEQQGPLHHKRKKPRPLKKKKPKPLNHRKPAKPTKKYKTKPKPAAADYKDFFEDFPRKQKDATLTNSLLSRTKFYEILRHKFEQHGFHTADHCLLRLICEANSAQLAEPNGILGSLMHVMFSPTSSSYEALPKRYYIAELNGQRDKCAVYYSKCRRSVLDLITRPLAEYIGNKPAIIH